MAGNITVYPMATLNLGLGGFNLASNQFKMTLLGTGYTPQNTDGTWAAISQYELPTGGGYTQGGVFLSGVTWLMSAPPAVVFNSNPPVWSAFTATPSWGVCVQQAGQNLASTDLLLFYFSIIEHGDGGTYTINVPSPGWFDT